MTDSSELAPERLTGTFRGREWEAEFNPVRGDWWLTFDGQPLGWARGLPRAMGETAVRHDLLHRLAHPLPDWWNSPGA